MKVKILICLFSALGKSADTLCQLWLQLQGVLQVLPGQGLVAHLVEQLSALHQQVGIVRLLLQTQGEVSQQLQ